MKSQEFLDILGDVDEKYVLAADEAEKVVRPKFRWQPWAAAAACAALICAAAWPSFKGGSNGSMAGTASDDSADCAPPMGSEASDTMEDEGAGEPAAQEPAGTLIQAPGLHDYFLFEEERELMTTPRGEKGPVADADDAALDKGAALEKGPVPEPAPAPNAESPVSVSGTSEDAPADMPYDTGNGTLLPYVEEGFPDQDEAFRQYQNLMQNAGLGYGGEGYYPEWFAGVWLDNDWPDNVSRLTVAFVDGWRTEAMENKVRDWCGGAGDVLFCTAKYSYAHLNGLMDGICAVFDQCGWPTSAFGLHQATNRIELDIYEMPSDEALAALARLDPDGDAIRVQVFTDRTIRATADDDVKPAAEPESAPLEAPDGWEEDIPADPGLEEGQPGEICELPLAK